MSLAIADLVDCTTFGPPGPGGELALDLSSQRITGARVVAEWVARAWLQPRGGNPAARGKGTDIRRLENASLGPGDLDRWRQALIAEARAVEFVDTCAVGITLQSREVVISGLLYLVDGGTYPLIVKIGEAAKAVVTFGGAS